MNVAKAWTAKLDDYVIDLAWSPDAGILAAASAAGPIALFDGAGGTPLHSLAGHADGTNAIAWMPAGTRPEAGGRDAASPVLASGGQDGCVRFWNAAAGSRTAETKLGAAWVEHLEWRPAAGAPAAGRPPSLAAAAGRRLNLLGPDGAVAHAFADAPKTLSALAWDPRGERIAAAWFGGAGVWDGDDHRSRHEYAYGSSVQAMLWSPDGRWLVAGAQDNAVHLWVPAEGEEFHMSGYETRVRELSFSADSRWLATGGARDACVWDCSGAGPDGREPLALPHADRVCAVAFQHRGGLLATAAQSNEVGMWHPARGDVRLATVRLTAAASKLAWSPDDTRLAIGSQQGGVLVLRVEA